MKAAWRWFGPDDPITLAQIRQTGATSIVTALHDFGPGEVWPARDINRINEMIVDNGLTWDVCESIWMSDAIKLRGADAIAEVDAWIKTMRNLAKAGVKTICYNFMPLLDWTRTDLSYHIEGRGHALRFDMIDFIVFDVHVLKRPNASTTYPADLMALADIEFATMTPAQQTILARNIIAGLPGSGSGFTLDQLRDGIASFAKLSHAVLRENLTSFLTAVMPVAEELGVCLAIHPDDPPMPLFGLPRCVSTADDLRFVLDSYPTSANGLTFCTGSLGARADNDLPMMAREFGDRIHFAHLRNVKRESDGSFHEAAVFEGSTQMVEVVRELMAADLNNNTSDLPFRPDHGHLLDFEGDQKSNPGYSYLGRLKGLAELNGVMMTLASHSN